MQFQQEQDYTKKLDAGLWRRLIGYMKPYHRHLIAIMATMAVSALCDTIFPLLTREAIDTFITGGKAGSRAWFVLRYAGTLLLQTVCIFTFIRLCGTAEMGINRHIRKLAFHKLEELSSQGVQPVPAT